MTGLGISFPSVLDDVIDFLNASGIVLAVGSKPIERDENGKFVPPKEYCLIWLGGGQQSTKVTADVLLNFEMWVPLDDSLAQVTAERKAEEIRAAVSMRAFEHEDGITRYSVTWPGFPARLPPVEKDDETDPGTWARVVFMGQITVRGKKFAV